MNDKHIVEIITEELKKSDVMDMVKHDKAFEGRIKDIVRDIVKDMFRVLWMHNSIFTSLGK